jgi:hypothetical protein
MLYCDEFRANLRSVAKDFSMPENRAIAAYRSILHSLYAWALRVSLPVMSRAPYVYLAIVLLLAGCGAVLLVLINSASGAVLANANQAASPAPNQAADVPGINASDASIHNSVVRRSGPGAPVQVTVTNSVPSCCADKSAAPVSPDELKSKIDDFKWVLTLILSVAGLFTVVQGIAAGFSAQNFQRQAQELAQDFQEKAQRILDDLTRIATETKDRYPIFSEIEGRRKDAYKKLTENLKRTSAIGSADEGLDWRRRRSMRTLKRALRSIPSRFEPTTTWPGCMPSI